MRLQKDVLEQFYSTHLGEIAFHMIEQRLSAIWTSAVDLDVLGIGFCPAHLERLSHEARRTIWASPAHMGAPAGAFETGHSATQVLEERLPFPDAMFDRILVIHGLEDAESPVRLLREMWRVTAPEGRILIVTANRSGLWSRAESTPFGVGRPFTRRQLYTLLDDAMFQPTAYSHALYAPPAPWLFISKAAETWEKIGEAGWRGCGGVVMVEAVKRLYVEPDLRFQGHVKDSFRAARPASSDHSRATHK